MKRYFFVILVACLSCKKSDSLRSEEQQLIDQFLADNLITASRTEEGVYQYVIVENTTGNEIGDIFSIYYTLTDLRSSKELDSHLATDGDPIKLEYNSSSIFPLGLDYGLAGIREGEVYGVIIPSNKGFQGYATDIVPKGAVLHFEIEVVQRLTTEQVNSLELASINNYVASNGLSPVKILEGNTRYKKIINGSDGAPTTGDTVLIDYEARRLDGTLVDELSNFKFLIGQGEVFEALDLGVAEMQSGETALLIVPSDQAYGASSRIIPSSTKNQLWNQFIIPLYATKVDPFEILEFEVTLRGIAPIPEADYSIMKSMNDITPEAGTNVVFTITGSNAGPSNASGVVIVDELPSGYTYISDNGGSTGSTSELGGVVTWDIGKIKPGEFPVLQITARVNGTGEYANEATISANESDPNPGDQSAIAEPTEVIANSDLFIDMTINDLQPAIGSDVVFSITAGNYGANATGVQVVDFLPNGFTYVSDTGGASTSESGGTVTWDIGNLNDGEIRSIDITTTVNGSGIYDNTATISGNESDSDISNNSDTVSASPVPNAGSWKN